MSVPDLHALHEAVVGAAAIRRSRRLLPAGGPGDKVFPPTYPGDRGPVHVFEDRILDGERKSCVLLDSVQSQANRLEEALRDLLRAGEVWIPHILTDFGGQKDGEEDLSDIGEITSLEAPHRVFDAIFRDSRLDGVEFWKSHAGRRLLLAKPENATAIFELSPTALVFGCWHSTGQGGGLGAKFPRAVVSEIVGVDAVPGKRTGSRIDPLGVNKNVTIYEAEDGSWTPSVEEAKKNKRGDPVKYTGKKRTGEAGRPSLVNHGNIAPTIEELGATIDHALHTVVISLPTLRRLRFPVDGNIDPERDAAARTLLAALALLALAAQDRNGYNLRSRCDLHADGASAFELLSADGESKDFSLDFAAARALYEQAIEAAKAAGLPWPDEPLRLTPQEKLVQIVAESRRLALQGKGEEAEA